MYVYNRILCPLPEQSRVYWHTFTYFQSAFSADRMRGEDVSHRAESEVRNLWEMFFLCLLFFIRKRIYHLHNAQLYC